MSTTQSPLLANLNDEQRLAVCHSGGPALVIAGAGSGKTRVLTHRIAHLISEGVAAHHILAVTFTNKAAAEMKQRVESLCGLQPSLWIGTFHSMCARLLRSEIHRLGMQSNFVIVDDQDQLTLIKEALRELNIDDKVYRPQLFREQIGRAKNRLLTPQKLQDQMAGLPQNIAASVYTQYQKKLFANNAVDFDDLLMATVMLLQKDKEVLAQYQAKFHHVLIDEYQDTNHAQYVLVRLLSGGSQHVMAVGDEDQSIYSFRGAEIHNILDFERDFPDTTIYRLQQNYRSTQRILNAANALIRNNRQRKGKTLWTQNGQGEKVKAFEAADEREEVDFVLGAVESAHAEGAPLQDMVIFYRVHALSRVFEEGLRLRGIPYAIVGGIGFYERREIKDALSYLRVLVNSSDSLSLKRIVNVPVRGVGLSSLANLDEISNQHNVSLFQAMQTAVSEKRLGKKASDGVCKLLALIAEAGKRRMELGITGALEWVLEESGYLPELRLEKTIDARTRLENLQELRSVTEEFEDNHPGTSLEDFLNDIALWTDLDRYEGTEKKITLMSLHSSKGLEFPYVFIAGLEEGVFPYSYWGADHADMEEERRLLYVGMTRARKQLTMTCARSRMLFGSRKVAEPSRFLREIEGEFLERHTNRFAVKSLYDEEPRSWEREPALAPRVACEAKSFDFSSGERVLHPKFGSGRILNCFDKGENLKVSIKFQSEEHPRLLALKYANLRKMDGPQHA